VSGSRPAQSRTNGVEVNERAGIAAEGIYADSPARTPPLLLGFTFRSISCPWARLNIGRRYSNVAHRGRVELGAGAAAMGGAVGFRCHDTLLSRYGMTSSARASTAGGIVKPR